MGRTVPTHVPTSLRAGAAAGVRAAGAGVDGTTRRSGTLGRRRDPERRSVEAPA